MHLKMDLNFSLAAILLYHQPTSSHTIGSEMIKILDITFQTDFWEFPHYYFTLLAYQWMDGFITITDKKSREIRCKYRHW